MHSTPGVLQVIWFALIAILWAGYFVLEGFDFGVGMLVRGLGRDQAERRAIIHTIGPVWDGNEVWLIVAGGATFAAFPEWYAATFSGFYLALFLVLACLIVRGVSFEFWGKVDSERWRTSWEWAVGIASAGAALLFGVAWANFIRGVPMGANDVVHASLWTLLNPYAIVGGLVTLTMFLTHGTCFLALRTNGELHDRARALANRLAPVSAALIVLFLVWTTISLHFAPVRVTVAVLAAIGACVMPVLIRRSDGQGFVGTAVAVLLFTVTLSVALFPNAVPSTTNRAYDLTLSAASSNHYALVVMTIVAAVMVPVVVAYQSWSYWVFRHRLGRADFFGEGAPTPLAVIDEKLERARNRQQA
jgi:cytochrome d ubiquinol oxidase subunit II